MKTNKNHWKEFLEEYRQFNIVQKLFGKNYLGIVPFLLLLYIIYNLTL